MLQKTRWAVACSCLLLIAVSAPACKEGRRSVPDFPSSWAEPMPRPRSGDWAMLSGEKEQSFEQYVSQTRNLLKKDRNVLYLQPVGVMAAVDAKRLVTVTEYVSAFFGTDARLREVGIVQTDAYSLKRGQYIAPEVMRRVRDILPPDTLGLIAIVAEDMFNGKENNDYVFGDIDYGHRIAALSPVRFGWVEGGRDAEKTILSRITKAVAQELSHLLGMKHCRYHRCLMNGYFSIREIDELPMHLCPVCLKKLLYNTQADARSRYSRLQSWYQSHGFEAEASFASARLLELEASR